jgi:hypothetical protein
MISLKIPEEPYRIELAPGLAVTVKPLTTFGYELALARARQTLEQVETGVAVLTTAGFLPRREIDLEDDLQRAAMFQELFVKALAREAIITWEGVVDSDTGEALDPTPERIEAMVETSPVGRWFFEKYTAPQMEIARAKKDYGTAAPGISRPGAVPDIADGAQTQKSPVPVGRSIQ